MVSSADAMCTCACARWGVTNETEFDRHSRMVERYGILQAVADMVSRPGGGTVLIRGYPGPCSTPFAQVGTMSRRFAKPPLLSHCTPPYTHTHIHTHTRARDKIVARRAVMMKCGVATARHAVPACCCDHHATTRWFQQVAVACTPNGAHNTCPNGTKHMAVPQWPEGWPDTQPTTVQDYQVAKEQHYTV